MAVAAYLYQQRANKNGIVTAASAVLGSRVVSAAGSSVAYISGCFQWLLLGRLCWWVPLLCCVLRHTGLWHCMPRVLNVLIAGSRVGVQTLVRRFDFETLLCRRCGRCDTCKLHAALWLLQNVAVAYSYSLCFPLHVVLCYCTLAVSLAYL